MCQSQTSNPLDRALGYAIKELETALRAAMDASLRPLDLTVAQYACLELLGQETDLSNAELARRAFVTRQSMNSVITTLQERGLITRPHVPDRGRILPVRLTPDGEALLQTSSTAVRAVEDRMTSRLSDNARSRLLADLAVCVNALRQDGPNR